MKTTSTITAQLINHSGSDELICQAARVSTLGTASLETTEAAGLINYLARNRHGSPFEHGSMTFLVEAPIFVAREHMRHRIGWSYNETSGRYKELNPVFWIPRYDRPLVQVGKPGEYSFVEGSADQRWEASHEILMAYDRAWEAYQTMLQDGVAREVARSVLPVGLMTSYYATCNPRSLMAFLSLRTKEETSTFPSFPQAEIEEVARAMEDCLLQHWPLTHAAFQKNGRVAP